MNQVNVNNQRTEFFEKILQASADGIVIIDASHNIIIANEMFCMFFNKKRNEIIETNLFYWLEQLGPDALKKWSELEKCVFFKGSCRDVEFKFTTKKSEIEYISVNTSILECTEREEPGVVISIWRDITDRKRLENELRNVNKSLEQRVTRRTKEWARANEALQIKIIQHRKSEELLQKSKEQLQSILDNSTAVIYLKDKDGKYLLVNRRFETLFHVNRYEIMGKTDLDIFPGEMAGVLQANDRKVLKAGVPLELEEIVLHDDGPHTYISLKFPLFDSSGIPDRVCGISTDITERKHVEEKFVTYQAQLKHLSSALSLTEERERRHISEDLHDRIGQALTVIKMKLEELSEPQVDIDSRSVLNETREILDNAIQDTRTLTFEISPPLLYELGFEPAVEWLIEQFRERHNILIEYKGNGDGRILDDDVSFFLFKSVRELLFNVIKHARADRIKVLVQRGKDRIRISIEDDGVGFDFSKVQFSVNDLSGFGLFSIRERMEHFGGNFDVESKPGQGTLITLVMSLTRQKGDRRAK